jgi:hypothetical protein
MLRFVGTKDVQALGISSDLRRFFFIEKEQADEPREDLEGQQFFPTHVLIMIWLGFSDIIS